MMTDQETRQRIPLVSYLELDPPHLVAHECTTCGARYFDRRNACASCSNEDFRSVDIDTEGTLRTFSIVAFSIPGVDVPFVAAIIDCGGTSVRGKLVGVALDPEHVKAGMRVKLVTVSEGIDDDGVEAIGYAFAPISNEEDR